MQVSIWGTRLPWSRSLAEQIVQLLGSGRQYAANVHLIPTIAASQISICQLGLTMNEAMTKKNSSLQTSRQSVFGYELGELRSKIGYIVHQAGVSR